MKNPCPIPPFKGEYGGGEKEDAMAGVYEKVRERLDQFPQGFPKTESGVELEILKSLFSPEEAAHIFGFHGSHSDDGQGEEQTISV